MLSGAKACNSCRSRQELSNEYLDIFSIYLQNLASIQPTSLEKIWKNGWNLGIWTGENSNSNSQKKQFELRGQRALNATRESVEQLLSLKHY